MQRDRLERDVCMYCEEYIVVENWLLTGCKWNTTKYMEYVSYDNSKNSPMYVCSTIDKCT